MRIRSKAWIPLSQWRQWFAWYPVRVPSDRYVDGHWVWFETVWYRGRRSCYTEIDEIDWEYADNVTEKEQEASRHALPLL